MRGAPVIEVNDFVGGYVEVVEKVLRWGAPVAVRGKMTKEVLAATIVIPGDAPFLPVGTERKVSSKLAAVEALQVIGGYSDPVPLFEANPALRAFADQGTFHGAYGPRIRPQFDTVLRRLHADPGSRRAIISIWDPTRDQVEGVNNYPCTSELQFLIRSGPGDVYDPKLDLHVTMRSNDAWHGLAYDAFVFNQLQWTVARMLGLRAGEYIHRASSLHLYHEHWPLVSRLRAPGSSTPMPFLPKGLASPQQARSIADGEALNIYELDESAAWYLGKVKG